MPKIRKTECDACAGRGWFVAPDDYHDTCKYCHGTGEVITQKESELLKMVKYGNPDETTLETANVLTYELGDLVKNLFYRKIYPEREKVHTIEAKTAMMDLLTQCQVICEREGWDFKELAGTGIKRLIERIDRRMKLRE